MAASNIGVDGGAGIGMGAGVGAGLGAGAGLGVGAGRTRGLLLGGMVLRIRREGRIVSASAYPNYRVLISVCAG